MTQTTYQPEEVVLRTEEFAYGYIIEVLTQGLYPDKLHVIREYVQNAYDAVLAWRQRRDDPAYGKIILKIAPPSIFVYDDGIGMDHAKISQYRYVGYSEKRTAEGVGFRGIGKLSGLSVAEKLVVTTSPAGVDERYKLVFEADLMLSRVLALKATGENIALNDLIQDHTQIDVESEDPQSHYTLVELYGIRTDSRSLMDHSKLLSYLSMNTPVPFDPGFCHGATVDAWLREYVHDYDTVSLELDGVQVCKPYLLDLEAPQNEFIWPSVSPEQGCHDEDLDPLGFCWYCEHTKKGQLSHKEKRGLRYRLKNFSIGSNQLPRTTLWRSTPERAFYFFGEIHALDPDIVPSASRDNFEQNEARERLYDRGEQVSRTLSRIAGKSSARRRAVDWIVRGEGTIGDVEQELRDSQVPMEVRFDKMYAVRSAVEEVEKRLTQAPEEYAKRGTDIVERGRGLVARLGRSVELGAAAEGVYDIRQTLNLTPEATRLYDLMVDCLRRFFRDQPRLFERLIEQVHARLMDDYGERPR